ncbi:hypothetical protein SELMODRAFT_431837 [Selaginella moellendorffii]|uniref:S1 motif domain-containing protein n=1 Tax=Selaginella moellendorffii TaxID=88036 RepID=D8TDY7_SELML|nr:hypothetical protein SELMODRAFT_431837 [Selaginella moellendorffii]
MDRKSVGGRRYVALEEMIDTTVLLDLACQAGVAKTLIKVTNHPRNRLMEAATLNSSRTGRQALSHGQPLLLTWECAHYRGNDAACSVITFETVTIEQSVIRYVQEVKDNWAWLVLSPHLKGCLFILDTSDDPSELERFKERFKVGDPFQCHIRSVNHERKQVDLSLHPKTSDKQFKKGDLLGRRITRVFAGVGGHTVQSRWESFGKVHGFVKNVTEKGCFVVLAPSLEARIQLKNLSNSFVQNPDIGKPLSGHIEMSLAATTSQDSSGWKKFGAGEIVSGRIHNIEAFGIFISLAESDVFLVCAPGCLCHVAEVSYDFIQDLSTLYKVGQWVQVKILKVDGETKRISLGMKASYLTLEDGIEPMEEEAINEEPSNTNVLMREVDLASKRFPQLCMEAAAKEKLLQKDQPPETMDDFERLVAASPNSSYM